MLDSTVIERSSQPARRATAALLPITHFLLAIAIALSALFGSYAGGDWTWWLSQAGIRKVR